MASPCYGENQTVTKRDTEDFKWVINRGDAPDHVFNIPELDFSQDLFAERLSGEWFRLGAWTIDPRRDERGVEDVVSRQSFLLVPGHFAEIFNDLESVGNVIGHLGRPHGSVQYAGDSKEYRYAPFHRFEFHRFGRVAAEPLAFLRETTSGTQLFINPDLWLFLRLEERARGSGLWWDPRRGVEVLRQRVIERANLEIVEVRIDYLIKYLQARQMSLVVGHYRHLHLFNPSTGTVEQFVEEDLVLGSVQQGAKAILQNWGLRRALTTPPFLQRRLHLWFEIRPPGIDVEDPWAETPSFDPYTFTLPTRVGPVAPARWRLLVGRGERRFEGEVCDFMDRVYFRQEVLTKYEGASGFEVADDGSVTCLNYWGLRRSTARLGNELLATAIGDFAEGVPWEEWPHWKQYAVERPSQEMATALREEQTVPEAVNALVQALSDLNSAFVDFGTSLRVAEPEPPWRGSPDSLAGRQLKWVYPVTADDDEFLKRATLASTFVIEGLDPSSMRMLLHAVGGNLHLNEENPPKPLGSRNLLQRVALAAVLLRELRPDLAALPTLVRQAESTAPAAADIELQAELMRLHQRVREDFAPLAFLYDLRVHGGLAHAPNKAGVAKAAAQLGLPEGHWHRADYLQVLNLARRSLYRIAEQLETASRR